MLVNQRDWPAALSCLRAGRSAAGRADPVRDRQHPAGSEPEGARSDAPVRGARSRRRPGHQDRDHGARPGRPQRALAAGAGAGRNRSGDRATAGLRPRGQRPASGDRDAQRQRPRGRDARRRTGRRERRSDPARRRPGPRTRNGLGTGGDAPALDLRPQPRRPGPPGARRAGRPRSGDEDPRSATQRRLRPGPRLDRDRPLHRRNLRLGGQRTGPRARLREPLAARSMRRRPPFCRPAPTMGRCCC